MEHMLLLGYALLACGGLLMLFSPVLAFTGIPLVHWIASGFMIILLGLVVLFIYVLMDRLKDYEREKGTSHEERR